MLGVALYVLMAAAGHFNDLPTTEEGNPNKSPGY